MRLIDADALLDIIDGTIKTAAKTKKTREDVARLGEHFHFGEMVSAAPTIEPPQSGWISVTDSLPEPGDTKYLVCCKTAKGLRSINMAWFDGTFWHGMGSMAGVTHWMPLPDLPEVGE